MIYRNIIRPLLFLLDPEAAHQLSTSVLQISRPLLSLIEPYFSYHSPRLEVELAGIRFSSPLGLAAGFDKTGKLYPIFAKLGFGFIECGTFSAYQQGGNPKPRIFRLPAQQALINRMGFNNPGAKQAARIFSRQLKTCPRGINLGKSKITPLDEAADDYLYSLQHLGVFADYITINISSPNTPKLRELQEKSRLTELLAKIQGGLHRFAKKPVPLFVKVDPDLTLQQFDSVLEVLLESQVSGIIIANTSLDHSTIPDRQQQSGGLSGRPIRDKATKLIAHCFSQVGFRLGIIGVGGIDSGQAALGKILAGASLVQVYSGYIYQGPSLLKRIHTYIDSFLAKEGVKKIKDIVGQQV